MTCIAGIQTPDGRVVIGGDSAGVDANTFEIGVRNDPKVFQNGAFLFGMCGSFRMGQLLHHTFEPPTHPGGMDDYKFMVTLVIDAIRKCFKDGGYAQTWANQEYGGTFLMGYNGNLYRIDNDHQVGIPAEGFAAVGCGGAIAQGALFATTDIASAEHRIGRALEAAACFSAGVRAPFLTLSLAPGQRSVAKKKSKPKKVTKKKTKTRAKRK